MIRFLNNKIKNQYIKDRLIVKDYYDTPYPPGLHDVGLYNSVDYMAGLCHSFIYNHNKKLNGQINPFKGNDVAKIEHNIMLYNNEEINIFYKKMKNVIRILKKYYNIDGTLKDNNSFENN